MMTKQTVDGLHIEQYIETRFNLLNERIDEKDASMRERIDAVAATLVALEKTMSGRFDHVEQMNKLANDAAKRAVDKAEEQQHAINIAANEWRGTLNDFKTTLPSKTEVERLVADFAAYRVEQSRLNALNTGNREGMMANKEDTRATTSLFLVLGAGIVSTIVSVVIAFINRN